MLLTKIQHYARNKVSTFTTYITLILYLIGLITYFSFLLSTMLYLGSMTMITIATHFMHFRYNHLSVKQIWKCLLTMYVFGVISGACLADLSIFGMFLILSCIRFYGEFQLVNYFHHRQLCWRSFLIYHSPSYTIANIFLIGQHIITKYIFQFSYKQWHLLVLPSLFITTVSMMIRIIAFFTAESNFTHLVADVKKPTHRLVTSGIYRYLRHPSYTGFFYNSIFGMVLIGNFISAFCFFMVLSIFFENRIHDQEISLVQFFGKQYEKYRQNTYVLIPYLPDSLHFLKRKRNQHSY